MKKIKNLTIMLAVVLLSALVFMPVQAKEKRKVTVAFPKMENSLLYQINEDGTRGGMMADYFDTLEKCTGWEIEYVTGSMEELYDKLLKGEIDIMGTMSYSEELEEYVDFPMIPSGTDHTGLSASADNEDLIVGDIDSLDQKTIAVTKMQEKSGKVEELRQFCTENGIKLDILVFEESKKYKAAVNEGKTDLMLIGSMAKPADMVEIFHFSDLPFYTVVSEGKTEILKELNSALYTMHRLSYDYSENLYKQYYDEKKVDLTKVLSEKEQNYLDQKGRLTAVVPKQFVTEEEATKEYSGFMVNVVKYFGTLLDREIDIVAAEDEEEVQTFLKEGKADFSPGMFQFTDDQSVEDGMILIPYSDIDQVLVTNLESGGAKDTIAVSRIYGSGEEDQAEPETGYKEVIYCDTQEECLEKVSSGKADAAYMDMFSAQFYVTQKGYSNLSILLMGQRCGTLNIEMPKTADAELMTIFEKLRMYTDKDEISQVILQSVVNQKTHVTVMDFARQNMPFVFLAGFISIILISTLIFWAFYSRMKRRSAELAMKEREENEVRLSAALKKANAATDAKSRFLSNVSHEMRTPLNGITGMLSLMDTEELPDKVKGQVEQARTAANHLLTLVSDVLDMSRIESGKIVLNKVPFTISTLLKQTEEILKIQASQKNIVLDIVNETEDTFLLGDPDKIRQLLLNIAGNSIKFVSEGGCVGIKAYALPDRTNGKSWYEFTCTDNGPGISEEFQRNLFEPFTRARETEEKQIQGAGLGLSIVKGIVDTYGGTVGVSSKPGEGTCFKVRLPFEKALVRDTEKKEDSKVPESLSGKRVLVAEDNELNLHIMIEFLKMLGIEADSACDGEKVIHAYKTAEDGRYDAILMDIQMPKCNGYDAAQAIRESGKAGAQTVPIIATTANAFVEDIEKSRDAGMNGHLSKPISLETLKEVLTEHLLKE